MIIECDYPPDHTHEYPADWVFGGADNLDPRADPRWQPSTYTYFDAEVTELHVTQVPLCDDQAIDEFTKVRDMFADAHPVWIAVKRPGEKMVMLPWVYDAETDMVRER